MPTMPQISSITWAVGALPGKTASRLPPAGSGHTFRRTRAVAAQLAIPKLRWGSYFPEFLERPRRPERALASVVEPSYLLGVSTRRVEKRFRLPHVSTARTGTGSA